MTTSRAPLIQQIPPNPPKRRLSDDALPSFLESSIPTFSVQDQRRAVAQTGSDWDWYLAYARARLHSVRYQISQRKLRDVLDVRLFLVLIWFTVLWWGERRAFTGAIRSCDWRYWEAWPQDARPEHVVLIADPQLVDPHTYPGRPWPLSWATVYFTDKYLCRSFGLVSEELDPSVVFFLGDLFDGGREWSPPGSEEGAIVEKRWRKYGQKQWFKEYERFARIFLDPWAQNVRKIGQQRKMVMGLPGNHDLGLGNGIRLPVRQRFNAYFGEGNRVDVVGNHSFVSLDTVSLSAKNPPASEADQGVSPDANAAIWKPTEKFLHEVSAIKSRAISRLLRIRKSLTENELMSQEVIDFSDQGAHTIHTDKILEADIPSILLTHVPLYRAPGTPCGPLRERWPPSAKVGEDGKDVRNSILIQHGKQYQNVLTSDVTKDVVDLVGDVTHAFSGDDHDYCDILHKEFTSRGGGIREITVKSLSWAMGVSRPGFLMLSLWNPVDESGKAISVQGKDKTLQTHLCLLPNQLGIFIRYALLLALTLAILVGRAARSHFRKNAGRATAKDPGAYVNGKGDGLLNGSLLPLSRPRSSSGKSKDDHVHSASSSTSDAVFANGLSARSVATVRTPKQGNGYGYVPSAENGHGPEKNFEEVDLAGTSSGSRHGAKMTLTAIWRDVKRGMVRIGLPVGLWYLWLLGHG